MGSAIGKFLSFLFLCSLCDAAHRKPRALITGGCGFVGRHFTQALCRLGWSITIVDNLISESALPMNEWPPHLQPREGQCEVVVHTMDCRDFFASRESHHHYDLFLHLAAVVGGRAKIEGSPVAVADDLAIDATAFQWAIDTQHKRMPSHMIYFSSSAAYPVKFQKKGSGILLNESMIDLKHDSVDIAKPDLTYGWAKLTGEYLAQLSHAHYGLNVSMYRPMSGYGEDQHSAYPFKSLLLRALRKENPIAIWSDAVRDFIHIEDIVRCVMHSYRHIAGGEPVNLGTGIGTSFSNLARMMAAAVGYNATVEVLQGKPQGVQYRVGSATQFEAMGCKARVSVQEGIHRALKFLQVEASNVSVAANNVAKTHEPVYSSFECLGGSQSVDDRYWKFPRETLPFPVFEPFMRQCRLRNVCWMNGALTYYEHPQLQKESLKPFSMRVWSQKNNLFFVGSGSPYPTSFKVLDEPLPAPALTLFDTHADTHFLDAHSNSYNFGHYILDNVFPHFVTAEQWGVPLSGARQVFESTCKRFGSQPESMAHKAVPFNTSMGTFRSACLEKLNDLWPFFFDVPPLYLEEPYSGNVCFKNLLVGQGSAHGLKTVDPSRAAQLRRFRDIVLDRLAARKSSLAEMKQTEESEMRELNGERVILVGIRSLGHSGGEQVSDLCQMIKQAMGSPQGGKIHTKHSSVFYTIRCIVNQDLSLEEEIRAVQQAHIIVSVHGTISYMSLFARDGTEQIVLYDPNENRMKEHNILMYMEHVHVMYHPWTDNEGISALLQYAMHRLHEREKNTLSSKKNLHSPSHFVSSSLSDELAMIPVEGSLIKVHNGDNVFEIRKGKRFVIPAEEIGQRRVYGLWDYELSRIPKGQ